MTLTCHAGTPHGVTPGLRTESQRVSRCDSALPLRHVTPLYPTRPDPTRPVKPSNSRSEGYSRLLLIPPRRCHSLQTADQDRQGEK